MNPFAGYRLTSPFGYRIHPITKVRKFHKGVDLVLTPSDAKIKAFVGGTVTFAAEGKPGSGFGNYGYVVAIKDNRGFLHVYAHLSGKTVKPGDVVAKGQVIGRQGNTGASAGAHLHYEIRRRSTPSNGYSASNDSVVEPTAYLQAYYGNA